MDQLEEISAEDLYAYRKELAEWRSKGPIATLALAA
jgi:hypothetical protein